MSTTPITLQELPGAIPIANQNTLLEAKDTAFAGEDRSDASALSEVNQNIGLSASFMQTRGLEAAWNISETLLRVYVRPEKWKGSDQYRSHLGIPILAEQFYSLLSAMQQSIFTGVSFFQIESTQGTALETARAQQALVDVEVRTCGPFGGTMKQEMRAVNYDAFLYGSGVAFIGWKQEKKTRIKKRRKETTKVIGTDMGGINVPQGSEDDLEDFPETQEINQPVFEHVPLRRFRVAPDCRRGQARSATWAARLIYLTAYQLDDLRDTEGFNIPSQETLKALNAPVKLTGTEQNPLDYNSGSGSVDARYSEAQKAYPEYYDNKSNVDPLANKWEVVDYWTNDRHYMILEKQFVILNEQHDLHQIPFLTFNFREAPDSFFGWGLGHWLGNFQKIATGVCNFFFDDLTLNLMGTYSRPRGLNTSAQSDFIFPGKVFQYDTPASGGVGSGGFQQLTRNSTGIEILNVINQVKAWASSLTGVGAGVSGSNTGKTGDFRTGAGVNLIASGENMKMSDLVDQICDGVIVPFVDFCVQQNRKLKPSQIRQILSKEMVKAFKGDPLDVINSDYKVSISAGTRLAAAQALQSRLGFIVQILQSPGITQQLETQGKKVLYENLMKNILDSTGYSYEELIGDMSDDDKKRVLAQSQAAQAQSKQALQESGTQGKIQVNENQAENRALLKAQEHLYKTSDDQFHQQT
jgi:hypothetical protein